MIRTRDLVIFLGALFALVVLIGITLFFDVRGALWSQQEISVGSSENDSSTYTAYSEDTTLNRQENISRLRKLLAENDTVITPSPSVESVAVAQDTNQNGTSSVTGTENQVVLQSCGNVDTDEQYARSWPLSDVLLIVKDSSRSVVHITQEDSSLQTGSSTTVSTLPAVAVDTLLSMPNFPAVQADKNCVGSVVIGVTNEGSLIYNTDAGLYRTRGPESHIGYARDGFPIYGPYAGQTDSCGGYQHAQGYRYSIPSERTFILGCYSATPAQFE
jgi:hypothetical protein